MTTYNTGNPLGSASAKDLFDNAENLDVALNSNDDTFVDRRGNVRPTYKGAVDPTGLVQTAVNARDGALAARDAAIVNSQVFPDEATGRAAVADGEYFKVIGSGEVSAREYKRVNDITSTLVAEYPSVIGITQAKEFIKQEVDSRVPQYPFNDNILFQFADDEGNVVLRINKNGDVVFVGLKESIQSEIKNIIAKIQESPYKSEKILFQFADKEGNVAFQINADGLVNLVGLNQPIQSEIKNIQSKTYETISDNTFEMIDDDGNIILTIDKESKVFIPGLDKDIASAINNKPDDGLKTIDTSNLANYSYKDTFIPKAQTLLNFFRGTQNVGLLAPVPLQSFEQNFSIGAEWIDDAKITEWGNYIPVETPYGTDKGVVHPQILEFANLFMGCRYIVSITGYTNGMSIEENPFLLGSNDLENFDLLTPVIDQPVSREWEKGIVYNSDPFMFYDIKTGDLVLTFREYWADTSGGSPNQSHEFIYARRTKDGVTWTDRELVYGGYSGVFMSQSFLYDVKTETYHMYGITTLGGRNLAHFTSKTLDNNWAFVGNCNLPDGTSAWHIDLKIIGDKQIITFQDRVGSTSVGFLLGISDDFHNFAWATDWWNPPTHEVYKASFIPQFDKQNQMRLVFVWTTNHTPPSTLKYKLFVQPTPFLDVDFLEK